MKDKPNVIFIIMDALRAKNLSCYGYERKTSPNIDKLAEGGTLFENAFSTNNSTTPSFLSILSGRHFIKKDLSTFIYTKEEIMSFFESGGVFLQEILKKHGYKTLCLNYLYGWQKKGFDYHMEEKEEAPQKRKFASLFNISKNLFYFLSDKYPFYHLTSSQIKKQIGKRNESEIITENAIKLIGENRKNNFFMRIDFKDTHMPYNPAQFSGKFKSDGEGEKIFKKLSKKNSTKRLRAICRAFFPSGTTIEDVIASYDSAIFYNDYLIGKIIEALKKEKTYDNTIILIFSDHGESLGEHDIYVDHFGLYDATMRVPIVMSGPGIPRNRKVNGMVQLEDIVPTVLNLLKISCPESLFDGKDLFPLFGSEKKIRDLVLMEEVFNKRRKAIRTEKYKLIEMQENSLSGAELYNLESDVEERENIIENNKETAEKMQKKLREEIKEINSLNEKRRIRKIISRMR